MGALIVTLRVFEVAQVKRISRILALALAAALCVSLCACGQSGKYKVVKTLQKQSCYIGFRNDDQTAFYVTSALKVMQADGTVPQLAAKWFGSDSVKLDADSKALDSAGDIVPRTLIVGVDENAFPMSYIENGTYCGFAVELAQALCDKLGWQAKFISIQAENAYVELSSGDVDVVWGMILDPENKDYSVYGPYMENDLVLAALSGSGSRLSGKTLVMDTAASSMAALDAQPALKEKFGKITRLTGGTAAAFASLDSGESDVILTDSIAVDYYNRNS